MILKNGKEKYLFVNNYHIVMINPIELELFNLMVGKNFRQNKTWGN